VLTLAVGLGINTAVFSVVNAVMIRRLPYPERDRVVSLWGEYLRNPPPVTLFSEVGRDVSRWPTAGHFVSWLALCPDNDISGGRVLWRGMRRVHNRAGELFRLAAYSLHHDLSPLGGYLRRMKCKTDSPAAITATARKIAIIFFTMVKKQVEYGASPENNPPFFPSHWAEEYRWNCSAAKGPLHKDFRPTLLPAQRHRR